MIIKTVGELRELLKPLNDECTIEMVVEVKDKHCFASTRMENIQMLKDFDYCHSENSILMYCEKEGVGGGV